MIKRSLFVVMILVLALSGLGILTASAAGQSAGESQSLRQQEGTAWLGVAVRDTADGVTVGEVAAESPAEAAGLQAGDVIESVDGTAVGTARELVEAIAEHQPGDEVVLSVARDGESSDYTVTLGTRPADLDLQPQPVKPDNGFQFRGKLDLLGLEAEATSEGLLIQSIDEASPFYSAGLEEGDLITGINGQSWDDLMPGGMLPLFRSDEPLTLTVMRGDETLEVEVDLSDVLPMGPNDGPFVEQGMMMGQPTQLGVSFASLDEEVAAEEGVTATEGALIKEVFENTPAAEAGLEVGDVVTAVNGEPVDEEHTLRDRLVAYEEGDVVTLAVLRGSESMDIEVTLGPNTGYGMMQPGVGGMWGRMGQHGEGGPMFFFMDPEELKGFMQIHPFMQGHPLFGESGSQSQPDEQSPEPDTSETAGPSA